MRLTDGVLLFVHSPEHEPLEAYECLTRQPQFTGDYAKDGEPIYSIRIKLHHEYKRGT